MKLKYQLGILLLVWTLNFCVNNGFLHPDIMEARNLITAREMVDKNNWLDPTMNNYPRLAKPPLPTWVNGLIATYIPVSNLAVHRIPSALIGLMMVFSIFYIAKELTKDKATPFLSALIAATAYYLILMSRQTTWDIYCHALMTVSIAYLIKSWKNGDNDYKNHIIAGVFMGLSFMSKGPVSLYAVLLPFFVSWYFFVDKKVFLENGKAILITFLIFLLIGMSWPLYQLITNTDAILNSVNAETHAWSNRHVKPFYQYWGFWSHMGIWSFFALATLWVPYAKKRISKADYYFLFAWSILVVVLLSIPAEKKERYLLPVVTPLSLLIGYYLTYLYRAWQNDELSKSDKFIMRLSSIVVASVCLAIPFVASLKMNGGHYLSLIFIIYFGMGIWLISYTIRLNPKMLFIGYVIIMTSISVIILPKASILLRDNPRFESLSIYQNKKLSKYPFYTPYMAPEEIFEVGKTVDTLKVKDHIYMAPKEKSIVFSRDNLTMKQFNKKLRGLQPLDTVYYDPVNKNSKYYVYLVLPI